MFLSGIEVLQSSPILYKVKQVLRICESICVCVTEKGSASNIVDALPFCCLCPGFSYTKRRQLLPPLPKINGK